MKILSWAMIRQLREPFTQGPSPTWKQCWRTVTEGRRTAKWLGGGGVERMAADPQIRSTPYRVHTMSYSPPKKKPKKKLRAAWQCRDDPLVADPHGTLARVSLRNRRLRSSAWRGGYGGRNESNVLSFYLCSSQGVKRASQLKGKRFRTNIPW